ncbi:MAG: hypothetical protein H7222_02460 [Methylotenera sp.]|nr:hypothetical protein [Oligoflexia bacterium]
MSDFRTSTSLLLLATLLMGFTLLSKASASEKTKMIQGLLQNEAAALEVSADEEGRCRYKPWSHKTDRALGDWNCNFLSRGLKRDHHQAFPSVNEAFNLSGSREESTFQVDSLLNYGGVIPWDYHYEITRHIDGSTDVTIRIHYEPSRKVLAEAGAGELIALVPQYVKEAEGIWNSTAPANVRYHFQIVEDPSTAHYVVELNHMKNPLYNRHIPLENTNGLLYANEIGHMLGLDDEHEYIGSVIRGGIKLCSHESLMCAGTGKPMLYHHYLILRRRVSKEATGSRKL